jgi:phosphatidylglycerol lysyltransferase
MRRAILPSLGLAALLALAAAPALPAQETLPGEARAARPAFPVPLTRGPFQVYDLPPSGPAAVAPARAVVVFASGPGGWTYWEDRVCRHLSRQGVYVLGVDLAAYRGGDGEGEGRNQEAVAADFERIAEAAPAPLLVPDAPVYYAGRADGAAFALAAAALPPAPPRLAGLLLVDPPERARYAERFTDAIPLSLFAPHGPGTFGLAQLAPALGKKLRVLDLRSNGAAAAWLDAVPGEHRRIDCPHSWRQFDQVTKALVQALDDGLAWLLAPPAPAVAPAPAELPAAPPA